VDGWAVKVAGRGPTVIAIIARPIRPRPAAPLGAELPPKPLG